MDAVSVRTASSGLCPLLLAVTIYACAGASSRQIPAGTYSLSDCDSVEISKADRTARVVGYPSLKNTALPKGVREIRIWTEVAIASPADMYRIRDHRGRVTGSVLYYWSAEHRGDISDSGRRDVALSDVIRYSLAGKCARIVERDSIEVCEARFTREPDWAALLRSLERLDVWTLPDEVELPGGRRFGFDGWDMSVELRGDSGIGVTPTTTRIPTPAPRAGRRTAWYRPWRQ